MVASFETQGFTELIFLHSCFLVTRGLSCVSPNENAVPSVLAVPTNCGPLRAVQGLAAGKPGLQRLRAVSTSTHQQGF